MGAMNLLRSLAPRCLIVSALGLLTGCAGMTVKDESVQAPATLTRPASITVRSFEPGGNWKGDFGGLSKDAFITQEMQKLDQRLVAQLQEIAPASMAGATLPASGYLVTGRIHHVDAGSGAARYFIGGFGGGAREVTAKVLVYDLARSAIEPVVSFDIEGGSRGEGGIIGAVSNLDSEWDRIARETRNLLLQRIR